ncbi:MAG: DNA alkylation repair protein [Candidatus Cloacimonetes bacterium]|nr:DNA alkylation repair protein [Candidatus Cloacimonadota bacterium]
MLRPVGRLDVDEIKKLESSINNILTNLDKGKIEQAEKKILDIANTPNYFVREDLGKGLAQCRKCDDLDNICIRMLDDHLYGIRATALFYFYYKLQDEPLKIIMMMDRMFESVPWETETMAFELWKKHPEVMKEYMGTWAESENEKKRALALHGIENIVIKNTNYVLSFVGKMLNDESEEVQKKITHILTQVGRQRPIQCYASIRRWLLDADERRIQTIWMTMKKLANIFTQKNMRDKSFDFISVTKRTVLEWKNDSNPNVAHMGSRLVQIINRA